MSKHTPPPAEAYLAAIVSSSDDAIIAHDLDGTITLWNGAAEQLLGYTTAEAVGQSTLRLFPPDRRAEEIATLERVWKGEAVPHFETVMVAKNGSLIDMSLTISPILNKSGQVIGASKVARNLRERRMAELAQLHLAAIVQSSDDPIIGKDLNGIVTSWNPAAERLFGYSAEEIVGSSITTIIPVSRLAEEDHVLGRVRSGLSVEHFETVRQTKDGRLIDVSLTVSPIRNAAGRVVGASKIARDIRERKQAEAAALRLGAIVRIVRRCDRQQGSEWHRHVVEHRRRADVRLHGRRNDRAIDHPDHSARAAQRRNVRARPGARRGRGWSTSRRSGTTNGAGPSRFR